jgi:hypothetical protein
VVAEHDEAVVEDLADEVGRDARTAELGPVGKRPVESWYAR